MQDENSCCDCELDDRLNAAEPISLGCEAMLEGDDENGGDDQFEVKDMTLRRASVVKSTSATRRGISLQRRDRS